MSNKTKDQLIHEVSGAFRAMQRATEAMDQATADHIGINRTDAKCLDLLEDHGAMTAGRLAELAALSPAAITTVLDRLEIRGYVRRVPDTEDRRRVNVEITELTRELSQRLYGPLAEAAGALRDYTREDLERILAFILLSTEVQERRAAEIRAMAPLARRSGAAEGAQRS